MRGYRSWSAAPWLGSLGVEGEITGLGTDKRGHMYFSLKDPSGVLAAVMFAGKQVYGLKFAPKNGDKVHAFGHIDVFVRDGKYQLYVDRLVRVGDGEVNAKLERLIARLDGMGLFSQEYKKPIPASEAYWYSDGGGKGCDKRYPCSGKTEGSVCPALLLSCDRAGTVCGGGYIQRNRDT